MCVCVCVEDIDLWVDFVPGNSNKLQKLGLEGKISWAIKVVTLSNFKIFNSENVKNNEHVHTWAIITGYITWWIGFSAKCGKISKNNLLFRETFLPVTSHVPVMDNKQINKEEDVRSSNPPRLPSCWNKGP